MARRRSGRRRISSPSPEGLVGAVQEPGHGLGELRAALGVSAELGEGQLDPLGEQAPSRARRAGPAGQRSRARRSARPRPPAPLPCSSRGPSPSAVRGAVALDALQRRAERAPDFSCDPQDAGDYRKRQGWPERCQGRGLCLSCGARRIHDVVEYLVEHVSTTSTLSKLTLPISPDDGDASSVTELSRRGSPGRARSSATTPVLRGRRLRVRGTLERLPLTAATTRRGSA
jgi:hypothetical protein